VHKKRGQMCEEESTSIASGSVHEDEALCRRCMGRWYSKFSFHFTILFILYVVILGPFEDAEDNERVCWDCGATFRASEKQYLIICHRSLCLSCGEKDINEKVHQMLEMTNRIRTLSKDLKKLQDEIKDYEYRSLRRTFIPAAENVREIEPHAKRLKTTKQDEEL